jgi:selenocysteine lyase/cysteine desulfurase
LKSYKHLFSRAFAAAPGRLHFAAHSHHLWPDVSYDAHMQAWNDAAAMADRKWDKVYGEVIPAAQAHIARELNLPDPGTITFAPNTHELVSRIFSAREQTTVIRVVTSDGEFHSFRRQLARWEEAGAVEARRVPCEPFDTFTQRFLAEVTNDPPDIAFVSHVMYQTGLRFDGAAALAAQAKPNAMWVVIDGYHGFMAMPADLSRIAPRVFYLAGGYKYAMAGEGGAFLHAPPRFGARPMNTGWFAEFANIEGRASGVAYSTDGARFAGATFDVSALYRFNAVRDMLDREGLDTAAIAARVRTLREQLEAAIAGGEAGVLRDAVLLRPNADEPRARYLALRDPRATEWKARLMEHDIITDARGDVLRMGLGLYHDEADIPALCSAVRRVLGGA